MPTEPLPRGRGSEPSHARKQAVSSAKPVEEIVRKRNLPKRKRLLGGLENEIKIVDPNWAAPQNDTEARLRGEF